MGNPEVTACAHPAEKRWQYNGFWLCCRCYRYFWGDKRKDPATDIYGSPSVADPSGSPQ